MSGRNADLIHGRFGRLNGTTSRRREGRNADLIHGRFGRLKLTSVLRRTRRNADLIHGRSGRRDFPGFQIRECWCPLAIQQSRHPSPGPAPIQLWIDLFRALRPRRGPTPGKALTRHRAALVAIGALARDRRSPRFFTYSPPKWGIKSERDKKSLSVRYLARLEHEILFFDFRITRFRPGARAQERREAVEKAMAEHPDATQAQIGELVGLDQSTVSRCMREICANAAPKLLKHGGKREDQPCDNKVDGLKYGTAEYWIARLKRDAETDPKAAALLDTLEVHPAPPEPFPSAPTPTPYPQAETAPAGKQRGRFCQIRQKGHGRR